MTSEDEGVHVSILFKRMFVSFEGIGSSSYGQRIEYVMRREGVVYNHTQANTCPCVSKAAVNTKITHSYSYRGRREMDF